jgi:hypothetical protein
VRVGLVESEMMRDYCGCGRFRCASDEDCVCVDEACAYYFSNLEEWERTTFLDSPEKDWYNHEKEDDESEEDETESDESGDDAILPSVENP